jgi:DMSO/TMAO reductase YedYZ molybdopterin-dependent catalytic subunit
MDRQKKVVALAKLTTLLTCICLLSACSAPNIEWVLNVSGDGSSQITYSYDELANMDLVDLDDILMERSRGEDEIRTFSGVPLEILLEAAGAPDDFSTITVTAADGYVIEITRNEMTNGIIALKQGGKWIANIDPDEGPIRLVFPDTPADRWVFQVTEIVVNP